MITLPHRITYDVLKSFWAVFCTTAMVLLTVIGLATTGSLAYLALIAAAPVLIAVGFACPEMLSIPYRYFNGALKRLAVLLRLLALVVMDKIILRLVKASSATPMSQDALSESTWESKSIVNLAGEEAEADLSIDGSRDFWWFVSLSRWVVRTKKWWLMPVIPWLIVLALISDSRQQAEVASHTYTLY